MGLFDWLSPNKSAGAQQNKKEHRNSKTTADSRRKNTGVQRDAFRNLINAPSNIAKTVRKAATTGVRDTPVSSNIYAPKNKSSVPWFVKRKDAPNFGAGKTYSYIGSNPRHWSQKDKIYKTGSPHDMERQEAFDTQTKLDDIRDKGEDSVYESRYNEQNGKTYAVDKIIYDNISGNYYNTRTKKYLSLDEFAEAEFNTFNETGTHSQAYLDKMALIEQVLTGEYSYGIEDEAWEKWTRDSFVHVKRVVANEDGSLELKEIPVLSPYADLPPIAQTYDEFSEYNTALEEWLGKYGTQVGVAEDGTPQYMISVNAPPEPVAPEEHKKSEFIDAWNFYKAYNKFDIIAAKEFSDKMQITAGWDPNAIDTVGSVMNHYFSSYGSEPTHAEATVQLFKDFGSMFNNYYWRPLVAGDSGTMFRNSLQNLIDCVDYVDKGARALDSARVVPKYAGMKVYDSQTLWQYSGDMGDDFETAQALAEQYKGVPLKGIKDENERALVERFRQLRKNQKKLMELGGSSILMNGYIDSDSEQLAWDAIAAYDAENGTNLTHEMELMAEQWKAVDKSDKPFERFKAAYTTGEDYLIDTGNIGKDMLLYTVLSPSTWFSLGTTAVVNTASKNVARAGMRSSFRYLDEFAKRSGRFDDVDSILASINRSYNTEVASLGRDIFNASPQLIEKHADDAVQRLHAVGFFNNETPNGVVEGFKNEFISGFNGLQDSKTLTYLRAMRTADRLVNGFEMARLKAGVYVPYTSYKIINGTYKLLRKNERIAKKIKDIRFKTYQNAEKCFRSYAQPDGSCSILDYPSYMKDLKSKVNIEVKSDELYDAVAHSKFASGVKLQVSRLKNALNEFQKGVSSVAERVNLLDKRIASISDSFTSGASTTFEEFEKQVEAMIKETIGIRPGADDELLLSVMSVVQDIRRAVDIARGSDVVKMEKLIMNAKSNYELGIALEFYYKHDPAVVVGPDFLEKIETKYKELNTLKPDALSLEDWKAQQGLYAAKTDSASDELFNPDLGLGDEYYIVPKTMDDIKEVEGVAVKDFQKNIKTTIKGLDVSVDAITDKAYTKLMNYLDSVPAGERSPVYMQELTQNAINSLKMRGAGSSLPLVDRAGNSDGFFISKIGKERQEYILKVGGRDYYMLADAVLGIDTRDLSFIERSSGFLRDSGLSSERNAHAINDIIEKEIVKRQKLAKDELKEQRQRIRNRLQELGLLKDYKIMKSQFDYIRKVNKVYNVLRDLNSQLELVTHLAENRGTKAYRLQMNRYKAFELYTNNATFSNVISDLEDASHPIGRLIHNKEDLYSLFEVNGEVPSYFYSLKGIVDRLSTQLDSITAYRNFEVNLKRLGLPKDMYYMVLEHTFSLSEVHPKNVDFDRLLQELDLQADSWFGETRLALDIFRKNACDFSYVDPKLWGRFSQEEVLECRVMIRDILSGGHANPRDDVNAQMLLYFLKDKDAIAKLNAASKKQDVFFLDIETHGLNMDVDAVSQISLVKWVPNEALEKGSLYDILKYIKGLEGEDYSIKLTADEIASISKTKLQLHFAGDPSVDTLSMSAMRKAYAKQFLKEGDAPADQEQDILAKVIGTLDASFIEREELPLIYTHNNNKFDTEFLKLRSDKFGLKSAVFDKPNRFFRNEVSTFKELKQFEPHQVAFDTGQKYAIKALYSQLCRDMPGNNMHFINMHQLLHDYEKLISITKNTRVANALRKHFSTETAMEFTHTFKDRYVTGDDIIPQDISKIDKERQYEFTHAFYSEKPVGEVYDWVPDSNYIEYSRYDYGDGTFSEARHSRKAELRLLDMINKDRRTSTTVKSWGYSDFFNDPEVVRVAEKYKNIKTSQVKKDIDNLTKRINALIESVGKDSSEVLAVQKELYELEHEYDLLSRYRDLKKDADSLDRLKGKSALDKYVEHRLRNFSLYEANLAKRYKYRKLLEASTDLDEQSKLIVQLSDIDKELDELLPPSEAAKVIDERTELFARRSAILSELNVSTLNDALEELNIYNVSRKKFILDDAVRSDALHRLGLIDELRAIDSELASTEKIARYGAPRDFWASSKSFEDTAMYEEYLRAEGSKTTLVTFPNMQYKKQYKLVPNKDPYQTPSTLKLYRADYDPETGAYSNLVETSFAEEFDFGGAIFKDKYEHWAAKVQAHPDWFESGFVFNVTVKKSHTVDMSIAQQLENSLAMTSAINKPLKFADIHYSTLPLVDGLRNTRNFVDDFIVQLEKGRPRAMSTYTDSLSNIGGKRYTEFEGPFIKNGHSFRDSLKNMKEHIVRWEPFEDMMYPVESAFDVLTPEFQDAISMYDRILSELEEAYAVGTLGVEQLKRFSRISKELQDTVENYISPRYYDPKNLKAIQESNYDFNRLYQQLVTLHREFRLDEFRTPGLVKRVKKDVYSEGSKASEMFIGSSKKVTLKKDNVKTLNDIYFALVDFRNAFAAGDISKAMDQFTKPFDSIDTSFLSSPVKETLDNIFLVGGYINDYKHLLDYPLFKQYSDVVDEVLGVFATIRHSTELLYPGSSIFTAINEAFTGLNKQLVDVFSSVTGYEKLNVFNELAEQPLVANYLKPLKDFADSDDVIKTLDSLHKLVDRVDDAQNLVRGTVILNPFEDLGKTIDELSLSKTYSELLNTSPGTLNNIQQVALAANRNAWIPDVGFRVIQDDKTASTYFTLTEVKTVKGGIDKERFPNIKPQMPRFEKGELIKIVPDISAEELDTALEYASLLEEYYRIEKIKDNLDIRIKEFGFDEADIYAGRAPEALEKRYVKLADKLEEAEIAVKRKEALLEATDRGLRYYKELPRIKEHIEYKYTESKLTFKAYTPSADEIEVPLRVSPRDSEAITSLSREAAKIRNIRLRDVSILAPYYKDWLTMIGKIRGYASDLPVTDPMHYLSYLRVPETSNEAFSLCYALYNRYFRNLDFERATTIKENAKSLSKVPAQYRDVVIAAMDSGKIIDFAEDISEDALSILKGDFNDVLFYGEVKDFEAKYHTEAIETRASILANLDTIKETSGTFEGYAARYSNEFTSARDAFIVDMGNTSSAIFNVMRQIEHKSPQLFEEAKEAIGLIEAARRKVFSNQILDFVSESETNLLSHLLFHNQLLIIPKNGDATHLGLVAKLDRLLSSGSKYIETYVTDSEYLLIGLKRDAKILIKDDSMHIKADSKMQIELDGVADERVFTAPEYKHVLYPEEFRLNAYLGKFDPELAPLIIKYYEQLNYLSKGAVKGSLGTPYTLAQHNAILDSLRSDAEGFLSRISSKNVTCNQRLMHTSQFDFTCLGDAEHVYKPGYYTKTDPFQSIIKNYEDIAGTVSAERMYISTFFDDNSHCRLEDLFAEYSNLEILSALKSAPDQCVLTITKGKTESGFLVKKMHISDELSIEEAKAARAIVVPYDMYIEMASVINTSTFSKTYLKVWAKLLFFMKVGHLCNPGTWLRNWIDATIKSAGETGSLGTTAMGQLNAMRLLFQYNKVVKFIRNGHGRYIDSIKAIERNWESYASAAGVSMTFDQFRFMESWLKTSISGGESQVVKSIMRQRNDATRRSLALRPGSTDTLEGLRNIRNGYDYVGSDIVRFEQLSDSEIESLIKEGKVTDDILNVNGITEDEFLELLAARRKGEVLSEELFAKYTNTANDILRIRNRRINNSPAEIMNNIDYMCSMFLSPMSKVEQVVRLGQYLALDAQGYTKSQIFKSITDSQFNYEIKGGRIKGAELVMSYFNFEYHNLVYWCTQIENNPKLLTHLERVWSNLSWRSVSNYYENEDTYNNESIAYMMLHGGLPIGSDGMYLKLNPSAFSALNWLYGTPSQFMNSVVPPIELLMKEFLSSMGGHYAQVLKNLDYGFEDKPMSEKLLETVPIAGTIYTRYYKHFTDRQPWERVDGTIIQDELVKWAPTIFGAVYRYNRIHEDSMAAFQKKLEKQGKWYDLNRNKVVDISQKNEEGLNNPDMSWEEKELAEFQYHNRVWDANVCRFVNYKHKHGKFVTLAERQFNDALDRPGELGLNRVFDFRNNPGDWDALCSLKWRFHGMVWDKNQRKFVFPEDKIPGMLNRDDLSWEETCYYNEKLFGTKWDSNQNRFVTDKEYIPGGLNDWDNLSWETKSQLMLYLFGKVWAYDERMGKNRFIQKYRPLVRNEIPDPDDQNPKQYVLKKGEYVFNGDKLNDMTVIYRLLHGDLDASGVLSQYKSIWRKHYGNGYGFHSNRWVDFAPKPFYSRNYKLSHKTSAFDSAYSSLKMNLAGYTQYEAYYKYEYNYDYKYRFANPRRNPRHYMSSNYRSVVDRSIGDFKWAWYKH